VAKSIFRFSSTYLLKCRISVNFEALYALRSVLCFSFHYWENFRGKRRAKLEAQGKWRAKLEVQGKRRAKLETRKKADKQNIYHLDAINLWSKSKNNYKKWKTFGYKSSKKGNQKNKIFFYYILNFFLQFQNMSCIQFRFNYIFIHTCDKIWDKKLMLVITSKKRTLTTDYVGLCT
jgi:hypothetical protein